MANTIKVMLQEKKHAISKYIYGHFAEHLGRCIYGGIWVGKDSHIENIEGLRKDIIDALKNIKVPVLRWPGGCFADEYHWMDGIGPVRSRKKSINTHWGMVTESHEFGTHEFFRLCEELGCDAYVAGNMGSGTVREMQEWVEYITQEDGSSISELRKGNGREKPWSLKFFGLGNESWACGGYMRPEYYSNLYRQYQTYVRNYSGNLVNKIACGANEDDYNWTETLMKNISDLNVYGISLHYYTILNHNWKDMGHATEYTQKEWANIFQQSFKMDELITKHSQIMDVYDPGKRIALIVDEWGTWHKAMLGTNRRFLYQQNTIRDAISAAIQLNIFHSHCERVKMANIAQTINVLQAMILTDGDVMIKTPTYHVFDLYKVHQDNILVPLDISPDLYEGMPCIVSTASYNSERNTVYISITNLHDKDSAEVFISLDNISKIRARIMQGDEITSHNTKENCDNVCISDFNGYTLNKEGLNITLPSKSISTFECML